MDQNILRFGRMRESTPVVPLTAGGLAAFFEPDTGFLRRVCWDGHLALLSIYAAVRDRNWRTVEPAVGNVRVDELEEGFVLTFDALCEREEIAFAWHGRVEGYADGVLVFEFQGVTRSTFLRNRLGFCVLHPSWLCAGRECHVEHVDGSVTKGEFPGPIAPHQPFKDIRAITYPLGPQDYYHAYCTVRCEGDTFEMEDQRNWTDASFKTYCTPLALPFPVEVEKGTWIRQTATVRFDPASVPRLDPAAYLSPSPARGGDESKHAGHRDSGLPAKLRIEEDRATPVPLLGHSLGGDLPGPAELSHLREHIRPDFVRVEVTPALPGAQERLREGRRVAGELGCEVELALVLSHSIDEILSLVEVLAEPGASVTRCLVLSADQPTTLPEHFQLAQRMLSKLLPDRRWGVGTRGNFAELNRGRPEASAADFVSFAISPQVHASDDLTILENIPGAQWALANARRLYPGKDVCVAPLSLKPQSRAAATGTDGLPANVDPRQLSLLGAVWALGTLARLIDMGASTVTAFDLCGMNGLLELASPPPRPAAFPSQPGQVFPVFFLLADLRRAGDCRAMPVSAEGVPEIVGIALDADDRQTILLGNPTSEARTVRLPVARGRRVSRTLTAETAVRALAVPAAWLSDRSDASDVSEQRDLVLPAHSYSRVTEE